MTITTTTALITVAIVLLGSAIWGWRGAWLGRSILHTRKSLPPSRKARASVPPFLANDPREKRGAMTTQARVHSKTLASKIHVPTPFTYIPLVVVFLCLWVIDTETWLQRVLLIFLSLAATAFLLWFGTWHRAFAREAEFRDKVVVRESKIPGGNVRIFDDASIELQTAAGTRRYRNFAELEHSIRASDGLKLPSKAIEV
jgi:hypothetical protein